jgi:hypothetical protein
MLASLLALGNWTSVSAFPPAPYHLIYGVARDQYGTPLSSSSVQVVLETPTGIQLPVGLVPGIAAGVNYQIKVPMDAGLTPDLYQANALTLSAPFKLYVVIGSVTNLPLQMAGNFSLLGQPGAQTRIDLTLGTDSNGDGIPDAFEQAFLAALGTNMPLSSLNANMDLANDGRTLWQEFVLGTAVFDPGDTFALTLVNVNGGSPIVQFPTMTGRSYTVLGSSDAQHWAPLAFQLPSEGPSGPSHTFYYAAGIQILQVQVLPPNPQPTALFLTVLIQ